MSESLRPSGRLRHRLLVRLSDEQMAEVTRHARAGQIGRAAAMRRLAELGSAGVERRQNADLDLVALATLLASEQTLTLLQAIVPEGQRRADQARATAAGAAEWRLNELREQLEGES